MLTIAHRISTVIAGDRIAVVEAGRLAECGTPAELMADEGSAFAKLVEQSRRQQRQQQELDRGEDAETGTGTGTGTDSNAVDTSAAKKDQ